MSDMHEARERLSDAISGERRDWHTVEVRPDDIAALLSVGLREVHAAAQTVAEAANLVVENNYQPDPSLTYDVLRWRQLQDAINAWREAQRAALSDIAA